MNPYIHVALLKSKRRAWGVAVAFVLLILGFAPVNSVVLARLRENALLFPTLVIGLFLCLAYVLGYFVTQIGLKSWKAYLYMLALLAAAFLLTYADRNIEERFHLLEYGVLGILLFKALQFHLKRDVALVVSALLLTTFIGWIDESWQSLIPRRGYDLRDVFDNAVGAAVGIGFERIRQEYAESTTASPVMSGAGPH